METTLSTKNVVSNSKASLWIGGIISTICVLFLLFDSITKLIKEPHVMQTCATLGVPENAVVGIGVLLLICTILYVLPRTAIIGAMLLTGYMGGATATKLNAGEQVYFSIIFGILIWLGLYLRNEKLRIFIRSL